MYDALWCLKPNYRVKIIRIFLNMAINSKGANWHVLYETFNKINVMPWDTQGCSSGSSGKLKWLDIKQSNL